MTGDMAALGRMAALSDLAASRPAPARFRLLPRKPGPGLDAIPERYRLEFLRLASSSLPGARNARVRRLADRVAGTVKVPGDLAALDDPRPLDRWFRAEAPEIVRVTARMAPKWYRGARRARAAGA